MEHVMVDDAQHRQLDGRLLNLFDLLQQNTSFTRVKSAVEGILVGLEQGRPKTSLDGKLLRTGWRQAEKLAWAWFPGFHGPGAHAREEAWAKPMVALFDIMIQVTRATTSYRAEKLRRGLVEALAEYLDLRGAPLPERPPNKTARTTFDVEAFTVTVDGTDFPIEDPKAFHLVRVIVEASTLGPITKAEKCAFPDTGRSQTRVGLAKIGLPSRKRCKSSARSAALA